MRKSDRSPAGARIYIGAMNVWNRWVEPTPTGLPSWRTVIAFPILVTVVLGVLIALGYGGTSSGVHAVNLGIADDPRLIAGIPRPIRSDEWLVQQGWVVSQFNRGYPVMNGNFPGGTDMTVLNELPSWDWSSVFRPHLWGYLFFGLDVGAAWHWWVPAIGLLSAVYLLTLVLLPRRPFTGAVLAVAVLFTPFIQWWYTPSTVWSIGWPLLAMAGTVWILKDPRRWTRWLWGGVIGYTAVTTAMGLYVPYILPGVLAYVAFAVGMLLRRWRGDGVPLRAVLRRLVPLFVSGLAAAVVLAAYVLTRWSTVVAIQSTVYPGQRAEPTGTALLKDPHLTGLGGFPWNQVLKATSAPTLIGGNSSEGSGVLLLALFLTPGLVWLLIAAWRRARRPDWLVLAVLAFLVVVLAYLFVPGWDAVAHILQLDRIPPERFRIVFVVLLPLFAVLTVEKVDALRTRWSWAAGALSAVLTAAAILALALQLRALDPLVLQLTPRWPIIAAAIVIAVGLFFVRSLVPVAALLVLATSLVTGWGVNPVYRGVFDLSESKAGQAVEKLDASSEGTWISIGSAEARAVVVESGVQTLTGVQGYPSAKMWKEIDPTKKYEFQWNRLGHVVWGIAPGAPKVSNPQPDVIQVTIDPCSAFARETVDYVVSDLPNIPTSCMTPLKKISEGTDTMTIYTIDGARAGRL